MDYQNMVPGMMNGAMLGPGIMPPGLMMGDLPFPDARESGGNSQFFSGKTKEHSVFYKTRPCIKYREGRCNYGDRCSYAHGEADLRKLPPEGEQIRARMAQDTGKADLQVTSPTGKQDGAAQGEAGRIGPLKTRLCTRFMQSGQCNYGSDCRFAHGFEDLAGAADAGLRMPMEGAGFDPFRAGMMMPGGPMLPPEFMMNGMMGMGGPIMPPRPPPGAPPPAASQPGEPLDPRQTPAQSPAYDLGMFSQRLPSESAATVPYRERIKAFCSIMGVGPKQGKDLKPEAAEAAIASVHSGEAFRGTAYSDALDMSL